MAVDRYQKKDILTTERSPISNVPTYTLDDLSRLNSSKGSIKKPILDKSYVHKNVYSNDSLIDTKISKIFYETSNGSDSTYDIILTPEIDVRQGGGDKGTYNIVYNFLQPYSSELEIINISSDSTEIELKVTKGNLKWLRELNGYETVNKNNLVLSFGNNDLLTITDIRFSNNNIGGELTRYPKHPTSTYNNRGVTYFPSELDKDDNIWVEVFKDTRKTTGRVTKFTPTLVDRIKDGVTIPNDKIEFVQERDANGSLLFLSKTANDFDRRYDIDADIEVKDAIFDNVYYGTEPFSKFKFYSPTKDTPDEPLSVVVKLYTPLPIRLETKTPTIQRQIREDYIERVIAYPYAKQKTFENFSSPNFKIDLGNYGKSQGTDFKTWNTLLDTNLSTSQQIIDKYISGSFGGVDINVDYSNFKNFTNYSSAVERVNNLKYKLELIESYDKRISTLNQVSGSTALTNISQSLIRKGNVVSGMDGWERWSYKETTGSLYTHYSASSYVVSPWPHYSEYPKKLYSVTSSQGISHYNGLIDSASIFDALNDARLTKMIPASIVEDPLNSDYILFVDMIGHHYDITWSYIKALTSVNNREEHPYDGMPNEMLYDVAKSMGWKLTHGKDRSDLWKFAVGTDKFGNPTQSGSLASKPDEQINYEVWRRIVNNIPYLLKTKGSARAVKALISTYGIPQTFLSIREYGGPAIEDKRHIWEHDKFVYHLRMDTDSYITVPWGKVNDINPITYLNRDPNPIDTIEIQFQQNLIRTSSLLQKGSDFAVLLEPTSRTSGKGNIHFYLSGSGGYKSASISDVSVFDSKMGTLLVQRETSVDDITSDNQYKLIYRKNKKDRISVSKSASIAVDGSSESSYNAAWTGSGTVTLSNTLPTSNTPSIWASAGHMSGSIQELRYWANPLKDIVIDEHTLSRETYHGNSATSSYFDLKFRFTPDSNLKAITNPDSHLSQHPNQRITTLSDDRPLTASLFSFENDDLIGVTEEYYTKVPSAGANNIMNNKVRVESNRLTGILSPEQKKEKSQYDSAPVDSNEVGVYLSATKMYNEDIYNHTGYFEIDDYIGNPDRREGFTEQNEELDYVRRQVFKKYSSKNLINSTIDILARYDMSVFEQIRQTMPARADYNSGILIEPHILERPKIKSKSNLSYTNPQYDVQIGMIDKNVTSEYLTYETTIADVVKSQSAEYLTYETKLVNPMAFDGGEFVVDYGATIDINTTATQSAEYLTYNTTLVNSKQSQSAEYIGHSTTITTNHKNIAASQHFYTSSIDISLIRNITAQKDDLENVGNPQIKDMYAPSTYRYTILNYSSSADVGFGDNWTTSSNGHWNYSPTASAVINSKQSKHALKSVYFYSSSLSASMRLSYSSSLTPSQVSTDELPLSIHNLRYLGCKMTSDSLTTNSPDTPDGRPVIEVFQADPNVLIKTSQTGDEGNLDVDASTNLRILKLEDLKVNESIRYERRQEYDAAKRKFRKEIERLENIEGSRREQFDVRFEEQNQRFEMEQQRRDEFDIINRPETITGNTPPQPL